MFETLCDLFDSLWHYVRNSDMIETLPQLSETLPDLFEKLPHVFKLCQCQPSSLGTLDPALMGVAWFPMQLRLSSARVRSGLGG